MSRDRDVGKAIKVAAIDGVGEHAEVDLTLRDGKTWEVIEELPWPEDWPEWVSTGFLREHGFSVITA